METNEQFSYREKVLKLVKEGKIKRSVKFIGKANDEKREEIYNEYKANQLEEVNQRITEDLINQFSNLMSSLKLVDDNELLKDDLKKLDLMKEDIKNIAERFVSRERNFHFF